jgi:hypothetical protein
MAFTISANVSIFAVTVNDPICFEFRRLDILFIFLDECEERQRQREIVMRST